MVSKKQRFRTFILVLILAAAVVGGVFGVSYYTGGVTFPWQVAVNEPEQEEVTAEPEIEKVEEPEVKVENKEPVQVEEPEIEEETEVELLSDTKLDYYGQLHVEDTKLVDKDGNEVVLTGISTHGINWYPDYASPETIKSLRDSWGINVVRIAMYTSDYNGYCVAGDENKENLKKIIDDAVKAATDNDMYVIIDWHILNDNNPNTYKGEAIQFFGEMVRKYESNENVIYEICNEPNGDTTWDDIRAYATEVIPVIRNVDKDAIILVGTPKWSSDLDSVLANPLDYDNIMYTYHFYAGTHKSRERNNLTAAVEDGLPVFVSEYGFVAADGNGMMNKSEAEKWQDVMEEYGISSCMWNLSNKDESSAMIKADCNKLADFTEEDISDSAKLLIEYIEK